MSDQPPLLLPHLVLQAKPLLQVKLSQQWKRRKHLLADISLPRLELFPLLQPLGGREGQLRRLEGELGRTENDGLHDMVR